MSKENNFLQHFSTWLNLKSMIVLLILVSALAIRVFQLDKVPPSPYWEEVALGYDAYSIAKTGKDHHGNPFPIVAFESFGDYKPTLYFYSIVPFIYVFGLNIWAVRLPSAIAGTFIVWGVGKLVDELFESKTKKPTSIWQILSSPSVIAMIVTTISPWAILFSRAGWEVNLATAFVTWGVYFGWKSWKQKSHSLLFLTVSAVLLVFAMYTYHATRLIAPLLGLAIALPWLFRFITQPLQYTKVLIPGFVAVVLLLPLLFSLGDKSTSQRFAETSIFSDLAIIQESNQFIAEDGGSLWARLIHHRYLLFGREILFNFFDHFQLDFLFLTGDVNPRHSIRNMGQLYYTEFVLILVGIYAVWQTKLWQKKEVWFLSWWLFVGIIPASLTTATPHALRVLPTLPVWMIVITAGIVCLLTLQNRKLVKAGIISILIGTYFIQFIMFTHYYFKIYPVVEATHWQYGYKELMITLGQIETNEMIWVSRVEGRPAMYYWFYNLTDPRLVQAEDPVVSQDQGEFLAFQNLRFVEDINIGTKGIIASSPEKFDAIGGEVIQEITNPLEEVIWVIYAR